MGEAKQELKYMAHLLCVIGNIGSTCHHSIRYSIKFHNEEVGSSSTNHVVT